MKASAVAAGLALVLVSACQAQTQTHARSSKETLAELQRDMPSERELSELLNKADEEVSVFEAALKNAKPGLDRTDTKYATNYSDAASTAHLFNLSDNQKWSNGLPSRQCVGNAGRFEP